MTTFHEGQEVEVDLGGISGAHTGYDGHYWRKAKIVRQDVVTYCGCPQCNDGYLAQFPDGRRAVFDAEHIRSVAKFDLQSEWASTLKKLHDAGALS